MVEGNVSSMCSNIFLRSSTRIHEVRVFLLWLHQHNPLHVWWTWLLYSECVMLQSVVTTWCVHSAAFLTMLMCYLFSWVAYLVTFRIEMMWIKVSCWLCCVAINWLTPFLMLLTSLVIAVPVSQLSASPKKGWKLFLIHLLEARTPSKEGSFVRIWVTAKISGL